LIQIPVRQYLQGFLVLEVYYCLVRLQQYF